MAAFTGQAFALSAACTAINSEWAAGSQITVPTGNAFDQTFPYDGFEIGEEITYTFQSSGPGNSPDNFAFFSVYNSDNSFYHALDNTAGNFAVSGGVTFDSLRPRNFRITAAVVNLGSGGNGLTVTITCDPANLPPTLTGFTPTSGDIAGGTAVTLTGAGLTDASTVTFDGIPGTGLVVNDDSSVTVTTPPHAPGPVMVVITTPGGTATAPLQFSYDMPSVPITILPADGTELGTGTVNTPYSDTSISASGGTGAISFSASNLPVGLTMDPVTGAISGTPVAAGGVVFSVTATDSLGASATVNYILLVVPEEAQPTFVFTPAGGALPEAMAGEAYEAVIAGSGASGVPIFSLSAGTLPEGLKVNQTTGSLYSDPELAEGSEGSYSFTLAAEVGNVVVGSASYTLEVKAAEAIAGDQQLVVPPGSTPPLVYLNDTATGGPFTDAVVAFVEPANAGRAEILIGDVAASSGFTPIGFRLRFIPDPGFSGTAKVGYRLVSSSLGTTNIGTISYQIGFDPEKLAEDIGTMAQGFVATRQGLLSSSIHVPGLAERRSIQSSTDPISGSLSPNGQGVTMNFSGSLVQLNAAATAAQGIVEAEAPSPFNIWADGTLMLHSRDDNGGQWGNFALFSAGADYLINDKILIGLSLHVDRMTDPVDQEAELTGNGWLVGPYASFELGEGVFLDTSLLYGGSSNDIDTAFFDGTFETSRWMFDSRLTGQWQLDAATVLRPELRAVYLNETAADYMVSNGLGGVLDMPGFVTEQLRVSAGAELAVRLDFGNGLTLTPSLGAKAGLSLLEGESVFGSISAGLNLSNEANWNVDADVLVNANGHGATSIGGRVGANVQF